MHRFFDSDFFYAFRRSPIAIVSLIVVVFMVLSALLANFIAPTNPFDAASLNLMNGFTAPMEPNAFTGETFLLGTDDQGRDLFSAILFGLRVSLFVGLMAVGLAMVLGRAAWPDRRVRGRLAGHADHAIGGHPDDLSLHPHRHVDLWRRTGASPR